VLTVRYIVVYITFFIIYKTILEPYTSLTNVHVYDAYTVTRWYWGPETSAPLPHCRWMSVIHGWVPSAIRPSQMLLTALGTVCPNMSRPHPLCLFSEVASRLLSSSVPSHDFHRNIFVVSAQWQLSFRTLRSFVLLTHLHCTYTQVSVGMCW